MNRQFGVLLAILCAVGVLLAGCGPKKDDIEKKTYPVFEGKNIYGSITTVKRKGEPSNPKTVKLSTHSLGSGITFRINDLYPIGYYNVSKPAICYRRLGYEEDANVYWGNPEQIKECRYMNNNYYYYWDSVSYYESHPDGGNENGWVVRFLLGRFQDDIHNYLLKAGITDDVRAEIIKEFSQLAVREKLFKSKLEALKPKVGDIKVIDRSGGLLSGEERRRIQASVFPMIKFDSIKKPLITVSSIVPEDVGGILQRIRNQITLSEMAMGLSLKTASCSEINEYDIGYKYVVKCSHSEYKKNSSNTDKIRVKVVVAKKKYNDLLPQSFTFTDGNISVKKNSNSVEIVNLSKLFAEVKQFSLYIYRAGEDSSVPYKFNWSASRGAISPDASEDISSDFWSLYGSVKNRDKNFLLNKKEAESSGLTVGVAVRYQMDGKMHTLFKKRTWPLIRLL